MGREFDRGRANFRNGSNSVVQSWVLGRERRAMRAVPNCEEGVGRARLIGAPFFHPPPPPPMIAGRGLPGVAAVCRRASFPGLDGSGLLTR